MKAWLAILMVVSVSAGAQPVLPDLIPYPELSNRGSAPATVPAKKETPVPDSQKRWTIPPLQVLDAANKAYIVTNLVLKNLPLRTDVQFCYDLGQVAGAANDLLRAALVDQITPKLIPLFYQFDGFCEQANITREKANEAFQRFAWDLAALQKHLAAYPQKLVENIQATAKAQAKPDETKENDPEI